MHNLLSSREVADLLSVSEETARKMILAGIFGPPIQVGTGKFRRHHRVMGHNVETYCTNQSVPSKNYDQDQLQLDI